MESFENSPTDNFLLDDQPYSSDGWTFDENKKFEKCFAEFDAKDCPEFFEKVALALPGKSMPSLHAHYHALMRDLDLIESLAAADFQKDTNTEGVVAVEQNDNVSKRPKKRAVPWTLDEHKSFLIGLETYGKGQWKKIARDYVTTRTPIQVASHAQKYMNRINCNTPPAKRRITINDVKKVEDCDFYPQINPQADSLGVFGGPDHQQKMHINNNYPYWLNPSGSTSRT